jgi:hypothetical protein
MVGSLNLSELAFLELAKQRGAAVAELRRKALALLQEWPPHLLE